MNEPDIRELAQLHVTCLTDSLVGELGESYVRAFYRVVTRSADEVVALVRGEDARIVAAAVVTLQPSTLTARLARQTPLVWHALTHARRLTVLAWQAVRRPRHAPPSDPPCDLPLPEMILTFTAESERGRGHGTALLTLVEDALRARQVETYQVRTVLEAGNRALDFYRRRGFEPAGVSRRLGTNFQVFTKRVTAR